MLKMLREEIKAWGHGNVVARHKTTLEITKESHLTERGDCIIAVSADRGMRDFSKEFRDKLRDVNTRLMMKLACGGLEETVIAYGHPDLSFSNPEEMVVRKSNFICSRTLAIKADKASCDLDRRFIEELMRGNRVYIELVIKSMR